MRIIILPSYKPETGLLINRGMQIPAVDIGRTDGVSTTVVSFWIRPTLIGTANPAFSFELCRTPTLCGVSGSNPNGMHVKFNPVGGNPTHTKFSMSFKTPLPFASPWQTDLGVLLEVNKWSHILINNGYTTAPFFGAQIPCYYEIFHNGVAVLDQPTGWSLTGQYWTGELTVGTSHNMTVFDANETVAGYYSNIWVGHFDPTNAGDPTFNPHAPRFTTDPTLLQMFYDAGKPGNLGTDGRNPYTHFGSNNSPDVFWKGNVPYTNLGTNADFQDLPGIAASDFTQYSGDVIAGT